MKALGGGDTQGGAGLCDLGLRRPEWPPELVLAVSVEVIGAHRLLGLSVGIGEVD